MAINHPLGDMLARIRNGQNAKLKTIVSPCSRLRVRVLDVLKREGFIRDYREEQDDRGHPQLRIELKYDHGQPAIQQLKCVSTPGRRVYRGVEEMPRFYNGLGISVVSTSKGVMADHEARAANVGGEVLCQIF